MRPHLTAIALLTIAVAVCLPALGHAQAAAPGLAGTSWQLVRLQGGDGKAITPDDRAKSDSALSP